MTREDVLRASWPCGEHTCTGCEVLCRHGGHEPDPILLADEIVRLRAQLAVVREGIRVDHDDPRIEWVTAQVDRDVLAALGGD